jgi:hypothetical protein
MTAEGMPLTRQRNGDAIFVVMDGIWGMSGKSGSLAYYGGVNMCNRNLLTVVLLVVTLSGCASMFEAPPFDHYYEGPERDPSELALFLSVGDRSVKALWIDGRSRNYSAGQYVLPGEHVVTFQWELGLFRKYTVERTVSFEAGRVYRAFHALLDIVPEDSSGCDVHVFTWIVDADDKVVAGYRPRQLVNRFPPNLPIRSCHTANMGFREHLVNENQDEADKGHDFNPGLFGG